MFTIIYVNILGFSLELIVNAQINVFLLFPWLYLWFSWISFGEILRILNTKNVVLVKAFFRFFQVYVFYLYQKNGPIDFPGKRAPTKEKYLLTVCQILRNFTEIQENQK